MLKNKALRAAGTALTVICLIIALVGCGFGDTPEYGGFEILSQDEVTLEVGDKVQLNTVGAIDPSLIIYSSSGASVTVSKSGLVTALSEGEAVVTAEYGDSYDTVLFIVIDDSSEGDGDREDDEDTGYHPPIFEEPPKNDGTSGNGPSGDNDPPLDGDNTEDNGDDTPQDDGKTPVIDKDYPTFDPYVGVSKEEFYADYKPARNYVDAYYRTQHSLMSGSISPQDQAPTISEYRPMTDGMYIKNSASFYDDDGNTYYVVDCYGEIAFAVFKDGAYVTLEEVAAYVYAFGTIPPNYTSKKSGKPSTNSWGEYLRLNHSKFSGDTSRYPYEPILPNISGCGGELQYYEIDIGTTGTDCDPDYTPTVYNNGTKITRGAARIVYTMYDADGSGVVELDEHYLFYTYNHYNDFQEYLNYEGGWGEMFGNITGGGTISSKYDCNPTPYVEVAYSEFSMDCEDKVVAFVFKEEYFLLAASSEYSRVMSV